MGAGTTARLILLNGPPGVGKSTLARRYADEHPLTLALEIDGIRGMIGGWLEKPSESGLLARRLGLAMVAAQLAEGRDVIVPQLLTRREFVETLRETAKAAGATFVELTLMADRARVLERVRARDETNGFSARALAARQGHTLGNAYDAFAAALAERPDAVVIDASDSDGAYSELKRHLVPDA